MLVGRWCRVFLESLARCGGNCRGLLAVSPRTGAPIGGCQGGGRGVLKKQPCGPGLYVFRAISRRHERAGTHPCKSRPNRPGLRLRCADKGPRRPHHPGEEPRPAQPGSRQGRAPAWNPRPDGTGPDRGRGLRKFHTVMLQPGRGLRTHSGTGLIRTCGDREGRFSGTGRLGGTLVRMAIAT